MNRKTLIAIVGPTAVGKTSFAISLASRLDTEIISADSRQIYREMEIGTAKPSASELAAVKHHFVNSHCITETFNAADFGEQAMQVCLEIFQKREQAVLCGGSGLYVKGLLEGFDEMPEIGEGTRDEIVKEFEQQGLGWLQDQIKKSDPDYHQQVDLYNPQRLMRALEVIRATGKPFSHWRKKERKILPFDVLKVGLEMDREKLYARIDQRMDAMIEAGLFAEAERLYPQRYLNALQTVGYQEIFGFIEGIYDRKEAIRLLKRNSRHYAKRQLTWFKRDKEIYWFSSNDSAMEFLSRIEYRI